MIYIDNANIPFKNMIMSHMLTDNLDNIEELHIFAEKLGLKKTYFQNKQIDIDSPHYDVCLSLKKKALELGAIEITNKFFIGRLIHLRRFKRLNLAVCECAVCIKGKFPNENTLNREKTILEGGK